jgi:glycosyltransferase involved in cell wall biosynthesis
LKAIESVLSQTYPHIELIVADDGSTDKTREAILSLTDPRIKYLELPHTGHIGKVRNAGVAAGKGEWIAFLDSDDTWLSQKLELQLKKLKESGRRWCYGGFELVNEAGATLPPRAGRYKPVSGSITTALLTNEASVIICTILADRKLFEETGGFNTNERLAYRGDYEFALRLSKKAEAVALPDVLVKVLEHPGRVTHSLADAHERSVVPYDIFLEEETDAGLRKIAKRRRAFLLSEAAVQRAAGGQYAVACRQLGRSIGTDHWRHWCSALYRSFRNSIQKRKPVF